METFSMARNLTGDSATTTPWNQQQEQKPYDNYHPPPVSRRRGRIPLLMSALVFCAVGILFQSASLQRFSSRLSMNNGNGNGNGNNNRWLDNKEENHQHHLHKGDLFVPSIMDYRSSTTIEDEEYSSSRFKTNAERVDCSKRVKELQWEWFPKDHAAQFGSKGKGNHTALRGPRSGSGGDTDKEPRLLIALTAGYDKFADLLTHTAPLAKMYAQIHANTVVVVLQGMAFAPQGCTPPVRHASLNKIRLLFHAIDHSSRGDDNNDHPFDQLLLLDADAVLVNLDTNITELLTRTTTMSSPFLLAAQPVRAGNGDTTLPLPPHKINAGATLWNLHHPDIQTVALAWFRKAKTAALKGIYSGDEKYLQLALEDYYYSNTTTTTNATATGTIRMLQEEFNYDKGTIVQHFLQHSTTMTWNDKREKIKRAAEQVCQQYPNECEAVPKTQYNSTSTR